MVFQLTNLQMTMKIASNFNHTTCSACKANMSNSENDESGENLSDHDVPDSSDEIVEEATYSNPLAFQYCQERWDTAFPFTFYIA